MFNSGSALAAPELYTLHKTMVFNADGGYSSDVSTARFYSVSLLIKDDDAVNDTEGSMTVTNGAYSFWSGDAMLKITKDVSTTFPLLTTQTDETQDGVKFSGSRFRNVADIDSDFKGFAPVNDIKNFVNFNYSADSEIGGATVVYTAPSGTINNFTVPALKTTAQQCADFIPYIEYVRNDDGGAILSLKWRFVKQNDISKAVSVDQAVKFEIVGMYTSEEITYKADMGSNVYKTIDIPAGTEASGDIKFKEAYNKGVFAVTVVRYYFENDPNTKYKWMFYTRKENAKESTGLGINYSIGAKMVDGKPDYKYAKYLGLDIHVGNLDQIMEAKFLSNQATLTIPGIYNIINPYNDEIIETIGETESKAFYLLPTVPQGYYMEYSIQMKEGDDSRVPTFWDSTGKSLNGKTISWSFPEYPDFNGSATVPNYRSVEEQLASYFPYFELTSKDGYFTGIKCYLAQSGDLETVYEPDESYYFSLMIDGFYEDGTIYFDSKKFEINRDLDQTKITSADWTFDNPIKIGMGNRVWISVLFSSKENPKDNNKDFDIIYLWSFTDEPAQGNIQTVSGLENDALNNIIDNVDGLGSSDDINFINMNDIGQASTIAGGILDFVSSESGDLLGRLNEISADADGWYVMKLNIPDELYDSMVDKDTDTLRIFSSSGDAEAETESESETEAESVSGSNIMRASGIFRPFKSAKVKTADSNFDSSFKILSTSGSKLDSITGTREVLMAGYLKAGSTKMYLGTSQSKSSSESETEITTDVKDEITSADAIVNALDSAASSDAIRGEDILSALTDAEAAAYGIDENTDFGNGEDGYKYVLLSLDTDTVSSGDTVYVNLLSGDSYSSARNNAANAVSGYFTLKLIDMDTIHWLLINTSNLKSLDDDSALKVASNKYVILARVSAADEETGSETEKNTTFKTAGSISAMRTSALNTKNYSTNGVTLIADSDSPANKVIGSSKSSSSGCNAGLGILAASVLAVAVGKFKK